MKKLVITGASGYIGSYLTKYFEKSAEEIVRISRTAIPPQNHIRTEVWNGRDTDEWCKSLEGADVLINLAGKSVNCRYTDTAKKEILESRIEATEALGRAISNLQAPPKVWIQVASATIYRHAEDRPMNEETGELGTGFSVDVCRAWEKSFYNQPVSCRKVLLRTSIVIGKKDGAFPRLVNLTRYGLGGKQGNGNQRISWIHEQDLARMIQWTIDHEELSGTFNAAAPEAVTNAVFMKTLQQAMHQSVALPAPDWLLKIGAWLIGTETELILKSRWVYPERILSTGFQFKFQSVNEAVASLISAE